MNRRLKILSLTGLLLSTAGCVRDKYGDCPPANRYRVSLEFSLRDDRGDNVFNSHISAVDLGIYDSGGALVMTKNLSGTELQQYRGTELTLDPGTYYVVGWGNVGDNTRYKGVYDSLPHGPYITYNDLTDGLTDGFGADADKIYYAPDSRSRAEGLSGAYLMRVDPVAGYSGILEFTPAHRTVKIYIAGYDGTPGVELRNIPAGLAWFGMAWLTDQSGSKLRQTASRTTRPEEKDGTWYDHAAFDTFHFDEDNDIVLNVTDRMSPEPAFTITLNEALEEIGFPAGVTISIMLEFTPAGVEISLPQWENQEVDPGLEV